MKTESIFLQDFFNRLNETGINYAVLRNYEPLPYSLGGSDLDILVAPTNAVAARDMIESFAHSHGLKLIVKYSVTTKILRFCGKKDSVWLGFPIDIYTALEYRGLEYADSYAVLERAEDWAGVRVLSKGDAGVLTLLKECLANSCSRKNYLEKAATAYTTNPRGYASSLEFYFGVEAATEFAEYLQTNNEDAALLRKLSATLRRSLFFKSLRKSTLKTIQIKIRTYAKRIFRLISPPGLTVAVLGTDGSGKSTIIASIETVLSQALHNKSRYDHLRPNLLPSIAKLFGKPGSTGPVTNPHASVPSGFLGSLARVSYYTLDYIFGYWVKVYPALVKRPTLHIFDRYYYDYLIDPKRARIQLPEWIIKAVGFLIPKPDLILCLGAAPDVIYARKPELPFDGKR